jgi:signal transduction histidine kinase
MADGELASYAGRPRSLHDRIVGMGGTLTVTSGKAGAKLEISLPFQAGR